MVPVCHARMGSSGVRAPICIASSMGYWKRLIKILGVIDCYYCINDIACLIHINYCSVVLVTTPDILFTIMSPVYLVMLSNTCYVSCGDILFMYSYTQHSTYFLLYIFFVDTPIPVHSWHYVRILFFHWYRQVTIIISFSIIC